LKPSLVEAGLMSDGGGSREEFEADPIGHLRVQPGMTVGDLAEEYGHAGVGAHDVHEAVELASEMFRAGDVTTLMGVAGAMVPVGMRQLLTDLITGGHIDVLVTTGANLTHDTIEAIGGHHHHGRTSAPGRSERDHDETLRAEGVDRIYDVYLPQEHFTALEAHLRDEVFPALERPVTIAALTAELGRANAAVNDRDEIDADPGIAAAAAAHDIPIYAPAIQDSILGLQAWMYSQISDFTLEALGDMTDLSDRANDTERAGALVVGGGVPKNYVLQTMLTTPGAYDYAVQLTTDQPSTGGLSGATLDEARSWGKLEPDAENVTVVGDATITLPLVVGAALDRLG